MNQVDQTHRKLAMVTFAMISGMVIFAVVVTVLYNGGSVDPTFTAGPVLRLVGAVVCVGLLAVAHLVSPRAGSRPGASSGGSESPGEILNGVVISQAIRDGAGMIGAMIGYLTGDLLLMGVLVAAAVASMVVGLPGRDEIRRRLSPGSGSGF